MWRVTAGHDKCADLRPAWTLRTRIATAAGVWGGVGGRAHHLEKAFPATICCNGRSHGAGSGSAPHDTVRTFLLPPPPPLLLFFSPSFCFRCFSTGLCFSGKLSTVSPINYVYVCCLLLHAFSGPVRIPDLLCNMARKYLRIFAILVSLASVCDNQQGLISYICRGVIFLCNCAHLPTALHLHSLQMYILAASTLLYIAG